MPEKPVSPCLIIAQVNPHHKLLTDKVEGRLAIISNRSSRQPSCSKCRCTARCCRGSSSSNSLGLLLLFNNQAFIPKILSSRSQPRPPIFPSHLTTKMRGCPRNQPSQLQTRVNTYWWRCQCLEGEEIAPCSRSLPTSPCSYRIRHSLIDKFRIRDLPVLWEVWKGPARCTKLLRGRARTLPASSNNCSLGRCWGNKIIIRIWLFQETPQSWNNFITHQLHSMEVPTLRVWESLHTRSAQISLCGWSCRASKVALWWMRPCRGKRLGWSRSER